MDNFKKEVTRHPKLWYTISMASENHWSKQKQTTEIIPMAAAATTIEGIVNFSNLTQHDVYNGQDTGAFSMTITVALGTSTPTSITEVATSK